MEDAESGHLDGGPRQQACGERVALPHCRGHCSEAGTGVDDKVKLGRIQQHHAGRTARRIPAVDWLADHARFQQLGEDKYAAWSHREHVYHGARQVLVAQTELPLEELWRLVRAAGTWRFGREPTAGVSAVQAFDQQQLGLERRDYHLFDHARDHQRNLSPRGPPLRPRRRQ